MNSELHPLEPFLPANARILMLGSFPPKRIRWSMDFFYPNLQNDMWRIVGYLAAGDKSHFLMPGGRKFDKERIEAFCRERGIALYDTAVEVIRLKDNASDNFLQVVREVDLAALLGSAQQRSEQVMAETSLLALNPALEVNAALLVDRLMGLRGIDAFSSSDPPADEERRVLQRQHHRRQLVEPLQGDLAHHEIAVHRARMRLLPVRAEEIGHG